LVVSGGVVSRALVEWQKDACAAFDEIERAHRAVAELKPNSRLLAQQLSYAYTTLLAARFQGFVRTLHSQTVDAITAESEHAGYRLLLRESLTQNRALDRHNAQPNSIAEDFARFGLDIWAQVEQQRKGNDERRQKLWALVTWRNAIAHHDIDDKLSKGALDPLAVGLGTCRSWRSALNILATSLDTAMGAHFQVLGLPRPW
jgi:hypothetical protein